MAKTVNTKTYDELAAEADELRRRLCALGVGCAQHSDPNFSLIDVIGSDELRASRELIINLTDQVPGVVYQYKLRPDGTSCFPYASDGIRDIYAVTPEEVREDATPVFKRLHPDDIERITAEIFESARTQQLFHSEFRVILPELGVRWRSCNAKPELLADGSTLWHGLITDITDQKEAEAELMRTRELYRFSLEATGQIGWSTTPDRMAAESPRWRAFTGQTEDEIRDWGWLDAIHPDDRQSAKDAWLKTVSDDTAVEFETEYRVRRADGVYRHFIARGKPIIGPDGNRQEWAGTCIDITDAKRAEDAMIEWKNRYEAAVRSSGQLLFDWDPSTGEVKYGGDIERMTGYTMDEMAGSAEKWASIVHPDDREAFREKIRSVIAERSAYNNQYRIIKKDGSTIFVDDAGHLVIDTDDRIRQMVGFVRDITARKVAEERVLELSKFNSEIIDGAQEGIIVYGTDLRYKVWNHYMERLTGIASSQIVGHLPNKYFPFIDLDRLSERFNALLADETPSTVELEYEVPTTGKRGWTSNTTSVLRDSKGEVLGYIAMVSDITASKKAEDENRKLMHQLAQSQKLESVGRLAGGIAHDFNNMLTAINGYSDLAIQGMDQSDPSRPFIEHVREAGERAASLTKQLLAFSRQQVMATELVDVNAAVNEVASLLQQLIGENIVLSTEFDTRSVEIKADPGQFSQILMNLAVNARDAMPHGGVLTIRTSKVTIDESYSDGQLRVAPGEYVKVSVDDTGVGIDPEITEKIFEPFFTTKAVGKGTGLGLSTVYGIAQQSGGGVTVSSQIGQGTTFNVYLPAVGQVRSDLPTSDNLPESNRTDLQDAPASHTILLVEDEELVRTMACQMLESLGYDVIVAQDGMDALDVVQKTDVRIDLLLTDVVMPQMGGRELANSLTTKLPDLPILFASGYTADVFDQDELFDGNIQFIQKPYKLAELAEKLRTSLSRSATHSTK